MMLVLCNEIGNVVGQSDFTGKAKVSMVLDMLSLICQCDIQVEMSNRYEYRAQKRDLGWRLGILLSAWKKFVKPRRNWVC